MLAELIVLYGDGRKESKIVLANSEEAIIYPKRDNITQSYYKPFKYRVKKHSILCKAIVKLKDRFVIMPSGIECHPDTTLEDIIEIDSKPKQKAEVKQVEKPVEKTWKFESKSDPGSFYIVRVVNGKVKCNCAGQFRAKDRKCKHMKEVMSELGIK
jgi:hypothetical protein